MTQQPAKRIPLCLTIDLLVIVVSLAIIGIFIAIEGYLDTPWSASDVSRLTSGPDNPA